MTPSVDAAAEVVIAPLTGGNWSNRVWMEGMDPEGARVVYRNMIGTDYFRALRTPLLSGRAIGEGDVTPAASKAAVINEAFARAFALGPDLVGRRLWLEATPYEPRTAYEIVGVVRDTKYRDLREDFQPIVFVPLSQAALRRSIGQILIRSAARSDVVVAGARRWRADARRRRCELSAGAARGERRTRHRASARVGSFRGTTSAFVGSDKSA